MVKIITTILGIAAIVAIVLWLTTKIDNQIEETRRRFKDHPFQTVCSALLAIVTILTEKKKLPLNRLA